MESRRVASIGSGGRKPGRHQGEHRLARLYRPNEQQGVPPGAATSNPRFAVSSLRGAVGLPDPPRAACPGRSGSARRCLDLLSRLC
jgi:hypothetical protein